MLFLFFSICVRFVLWNCMVWFWVKKKIKCVMFVVYICYYYYNECSPRRQCFPLFVNNYFTNHSFQLHYPVLQFPSSEFLQTLYFVSMVSCSSQFCLESGWIEINAQYDLFFADYSQQLLVCHLVQSSRFSRRRISYFCFFLSNFKCSNLKFCFVCPILLTWFWFSNKLN